MELVDSKNNKLDMRELIIRALQLEKRANADPSSIQDMTTKVIAELSLKTTEAIQIGNTFFIAQRGLKFPNKLEGRFLNVDTGKNFVKNFYNYLAHLQREGITNYISEIKDKRLIPAMTLVSNKLRTVDTTVSVGSNAKTSGIFVKFGKQPIRMLE